MAKYTHDEAVEAAERLGSLYNVHTTVVDGDYSFVGIFLSPQEPCLCTIDEESRIAMLRKLAHIIVQTDEDIRQEDPDLVENIKDLPGGVREIIGYDENGTPYSEEYYSIYSARHVHNEH